MIYTIRKVTVRNGVSTIDSPIILYRGDKEVDIKFEIIDIQFKFRGNNGNLIDNTKASFGQLAIQNPDGHDTFTEIAACEDGKVVFRITEEMIDEIHEVGMYSFHIRLFDEDQTSRITIPHIQNGIEIKEPLVIEGDDYGEVAMVNYGKVDEAVIENEQATFLDENGNLNIEWKKGDIISSLRLNQMVGYINDHAVPGEQGPQGEKGEQGEKGDDGYTPIKGVDYFTTADKEEMLSGYATESFVSESIANAQLGGDGEVDLSAYATKNYVDSEINKIELMPGPKGDTGEKGEDGLTTSISVNGLTFVQQNGLITLPDYPEAVDDNESNIQDLELRNDVLYLVDKDGNKIGDGVTISIEANNESLAGYIESVPGNNLVIGTNAISFVDNTGATISGSFTNYIPMKKGQCYISNLSYTRYYFFDIEKNCISSVTYLANPQIFTPSADGYLLIKLSNQENPIVLEGTDIDGYKEDAFKIQKDKIQPISKWYGKKWLCIGDSITTDTKQYADVGYAKLISRELGMILTNVAASGKIMSYYYDLIDGYPENYDLITVMLGANNHGYNCAIGELNDEVYANGTYNSNGSFYAQTQLLYEKLRAKYPKSVIMFIGLIKRWAPNESSSNEDGYMINAQGNTTQAYCEALEKMCAWYSIPYVDVYNTIDPRSLLNRQTFFCGETDGTHPNDIGHALFIAPVIRDAIIKHEPYFFNDWSTVIQYGEIQVDTSTLSLNEGASGTINVTLDKAPTYDQTVNITSDNTDVTISPSSLVFTSDNFRTPQVITITVAEDDDEYADETANVILSTSGVSNVTVSVSITDNDEEPTTDPDEPTTDPDEPQTANLIHKWLGVDTAEVDEQYGYLTLHDQAGELDLTSAKFWMNNTSANGDYVVEEYRVQQKISADLWDMPDGMSFSMKINQYTRLGNYFSGLKMLHTGAINGMNIITDNWSGYNGTAMGRFTLVVSSTSTSAFGNGVISIMYQNSTGLVELKGDSTIKMLNRNDTVDILLTFDSETNTVELYQDGTKVLSSVLDTPLKIDGIINTMTNAGDHTYESIEIYDAVISNK